MEIDRWKTSASLMLIAWLMSFIVESGRQDLIAKVDRLLAVCVCVQDDWLTPKINAVLIYAKIAGLELGPFHKSWVGAFSGSQKIWQPLNRLWRTF
eukprot:scaffold10929_cov210-Skeletonema_marinoi.AAC.3